MKQSHRTMAVMLPMIALLVLDVTVFVVQKFASNHAQGAGGELAYYVRLASRPWMWAALALGPIQLWMWTRILGKVDLSLAYPISALSYPLTMAAAVVLLGEKLHWAVWIGGLLITVGVCIMGSGKGHGVEEPKPRNAEGGL